ncbi:MAG: hypothetical protein ABIY70_03280 [Capsulimonas sp.]|uniref:hypothetical protein n=1 Tax=Capsulimonas sp. TaxID=2494211 RepID=UPI003267A323
MNIRRLFPTICVCVPLFFAIAPGYADEAAGTDAVSGQITPAMDGRIPDARILGIAPMGAGDELSWRDAEGKPITLAPEYVNLFTEQYRKSSRENLQDNQQGVWMLVEIKGAPSGTASDVHVLGAVSRLVESVQRPNDVRLCLVAAFLPKGRYSCSVRVKSHHIVNNCDAFGTG